MLNLHARIHAAKDSADFTLLVSVFEADGSAGATIASIRVDDPEIGTRLRDIAQAFRMGARYGKED